MSASERQTYLQQITQRLVIFTAAVLLLLALSLYGFIQLSDHERKSYLVLLVFACGLLGGFVSIQQRLPKISLDEMRVLSCSWISITLIPINGGIFALVLMLMFAGKIIQGQLFPVYPDSFSITDAHSFTQWLMDSYPVSGVDVAKLLFWSFVAGFSERFVPQVIRRTTDDVDSDGATNTPTGKQSGG